MGMCGTVGYMSLNVSNLPLTIGKSGVNPQCKLPVS